MCADIRTDARRETWISTEMRQAYIRLHHLGYAHSVECWSDGALTGGLYGIALDRVFFGESMFSAVSNASKIALIHLVARLREKSFQMIDCQMTTQHLLRLGRGNRQVKDSANCCARIFNQQPQTVTGPMTRKKNHDQCAG